MHSLQHIRDSQNSATLSFNSQVSINISYYCGITGRTRWIDNFICWENLG
ncbi:predicted protein [Botrytis cinerea T4]|uniref:Uncharacterized protein n=1 Tax=Botryotinia fuckeliana (strain T4) TaxID=999810 RepID=G2YXC1_BOTF4|nr:predicted protein [Botrytis cinerea T4]